LRIFLAGATGVIGRELLPLLIERGHEVVALTRREEEVPRLKSVGAESAVADVFDAKGLRTVVIKARPEAVVHELTDLPDAFDPGRIAEQFAANNRIRREGTRNLLSGAKAAGARRIVAQSIAYSYKPVGSRIKTEDAPLFVDAPEPWGGSVRAAKDLEETVLGTEGIEGVVLRYGHLYGPNTYFAPDGQIGQGVLAGIVPIAGEGEGIFSFVHVEDAASATVAAVEGWPSSVYNVCNDEPACAREWMPYYAEIMGVGQPPRISKEELLEAAGWLTMHQITEMRGASNARAREQGWAPKYPSWRDGFADLARRAGNPHAPQTTKDDESRR
jgi:nucleoside-diphosphate-sugar epimerase